MIHGWYNKTKSIPIDDILNEVLGLSSLSWQDALDEAQEMATSILKVLQDHHKPGPRWLMIAAFLIIADRFAMSERFKQN